MTGAIWTPKNMIEGSAESYHWTRRWHTYTAALSNMYQDGHHESPLSCSPPWDLLALCGHASGTPPGCFVEVGVYKGGSAYQLMRVAKNQGREIFLYDTFTGMPYWDPPIDEIAPGELAWTSEAEVRALLGDYPYIESAVFPQVQRPPPAPIAFAHIDVDQYQAHIDTCLFLAPLMAPGGIMWFDDVTDLESARKAVRDLFPAEAILTEPLSKRWYVVFT
jgi:Macrocin-O-methyltransferase (TylF)